MNSSKQKIPFFTYILAAGLIAIGVSYSAFAAENSFELFMKKLGGKIPFPPSQIIDVLNGKCLLTASIFPQGRSLERSATDFNQPRNLFTCQMDGNLTTIQDLKFLWRTPRVTNSCKSFLEMKKRNLSFVS